MSGVKDCQLEQSQAGMLAVLFKTKPVRRQALPGLTIHLHPLHGEVYLFFCDY